MTWTSTVAPSSSKDPASAAMATPATSLAPAWTRPFHVFVAPKTVPAPAPMALIVAVMATP
ncbi:hypothetical protein ACFQER_06050 [Halomicroarcula sp. GCM10025894]|uniref:hypothetical protein n=1 Tax=Halomicroarcula sp. GCM10025894 TaxID=3252673 RepID=UPI00361AC800